VRPSDLLSRRDLESALLEIAESRELSWFTHDCTENDPPRPRGDDVSWIPLPRKNSEMSSRLREALRHWWAMSNEDLAALPEVSRHDAPQVSPQEYDCGCVTVTRVTDRTERPFEMRLVAPCGTPSCHVKTPQEDVR
jgi:hypothetical protein